jgi:hypothetical protein
MIHHFRRCAFVALAVCALAACKDSEERKEQSATVSDTAETLKVKAASFNADTAYSYVATQAAMGPRTPGSEAQRKCAAWMQAKLSAFCDTVYRQEATVKGGDKKALPCINLIGSIHPAAGRRILLLTHWDSRPWADEDTKDKDKPIIAADDAGSGVGVLLELARALKSQPLPADLGIDIFFTDVEDYGKSEWGDNSYCLGTQYWAKNPHVPGYKAQYGILLDMVGGHGSTFPMEQTSSAYPGAGRVQQNIWQAAGRAGYSAFFPYVQGAGVTDDHKFVNEMTGIPTVDIIALTNAPGSPFASHWHTHADNMSIIDKSTLQAVGQTLLQVLAEESSNSVATAAQ